jgi:hypothetical protein
MVRGHRLAVHPSGEWVAGTTGNLSLASLSETPRVVQVHVGGSRQIPEKHRAAIIERLESSMDSRNAKATRQQLEEKLAAVWRSMPASSTEEPWAVGFSRNGCWIWCGTERGIRVYDWLSAVKEDHAEWMHPQWTVDVPKRVGEEGVLTVCAVAEEPGGRGIAFGGDGGTVYRLDLETGEVRVVVVALPGIMRVDSLTFAVDGRYLGVVSTEAKVERRSLWPKTYWEVWDYSKLLARVVDGVGCEGVGDPPQKR